MNPEEAPALDYSERAGQVLTILAGKKVETELQLSGGVHLMDPEAFVRATVGLVSLWAVKDPESFGYAARIIYAEQFIDETDDNNRALSDLVKWISDHVLDLCDEHHGEGGGSDS